MFRKLLHTGEIDVDGHVYAAHYYELKTARGGRRFSCEVVLDEEGDRIILDDDSMTSLQARSAPGTGDDPAGPWRRSDRR
jgi:hypothetical protein